MYSTGTIETEMSDWIVRRRYLVVGYLIEVIPILTFQVNLGYQRHRKVDC